LTAKFGISDGNAIALGGNRSEITRPTPLRGIAAVTALLYQSDVPARAALRRLPDRVMAFAVGDRALKFRPMLLESAGVLEQDR